MAEGSNLNAQLLVWLLAAVVCLWLRFGGNRPSSGLVVVWVTGLWLLNWLPAYVSSQPDAPADMADGFPVCVVAILAGTVGVALATATNRRLSVARVPPAPRAQRNVMRFGLVAYVTSMLGVITFPSLTSIFSTAANLLVLSIAWRLRSELVRGFGAASLGWMGVALLFPFVTTTVSGFIGFGAFASLIVLVHQITSARRRLWMVPVALIALYSALSVYVTYMRDRDAIRGQVWGGQSISARVEALADTFSRFELFSTADPEHQRLVGLRLDQVSFVGAARRNLEFGVVDYARGETLVDAVIALIPRVLWPEKPAVGGSGSLVTRFTGQKFAEGTSVGVTQVLEGFINFGFSGVALLFCGLGFFLGRADAIAGASLEAGDFPRFLSVTLPVVALLNVGGSLMETTVSAAAGFIIIWALRKGGFLSETLAGRVANRGLMPVRPGPPEISR